jgi:crotonobetainyl-CoA:carnitine CoA-transferase CaiB-like acyl-CoA transferase
MRAYGPLKLVRSPVRLSRTSTSLRCAALEAGAQTREVLQEYGYTPDEIATLIASGVVAVARTVSRKEKERSK